MPHRSKRRRSVSSTAWVWGGIAGIVLLGACIYLLWAPPGEATASTDNSTPNEPARSPNLLKGSMLVIAHRGQLAGHPENSLEGIRAALAGPDVDGVEMDVRVDVSGHLRLAHDAPVPDEAPFLEDALALLREQGPAARKFFVLDIKGDGLFASTVYHAVPSDLRNRTIVQVHSVAEAAVFRDTAPDARLFVALPHAFQGEVLPRYLGAEAVVLNAGKASMVDIQIHQRAGTPIVIHALNSMRRAHDLGILGVIVGVGATGEVGETLGPTK